MSYGPIWYEWQKREATEADFYEVGGEGNTHTRYGVGKTLVTDVYWCQPALYHGAPGFTRTKFRRLIATVYQTPYCTNDESGDRVYIRSHGFMEAHVLKLVLDYALSDDKEPGTDRAGRAADVEYVPGHDYPCLWCDRTAEKVCRGYYDPACVDAQGRQHFIYSAMHDFDTKCHAKRYDTLFRNDGTKETIPFSKRCYRGRGHEGEHGSGYGLDGWNPEIYPVQERGEWTCPTEEELVVARAKLLEESTATVGRCRTGKMDGNGNHLGNTFATDAPSATITTTEETP